MRRNNTIYAMTIIAMMIGIMFLMGFTPLGTIPAGVLTITLLGIPVAIVCCLFGPWMGLLIGAIWGTISLIQGLTGLDPSGPILWEYSPIGLVVTCYIPRMLTGFIAGTTYELNRRWDKKGYWSAVISSALVSLLNTALFMTSYCLFFFSSPAVQDSAKTLGQTTGWNTLNPFLFIIAAIGWNFLAEFLVNAVAGSACAYGVKTAADKLGFESPFSKSKEQKDK